MASRSRPVHTVEIHVESIGVLVNVVGAGSVATSGQD
jgi:hypothetical protein